MHSLVRTVPHLRRRSTEAGEKFKDQISRIHVDYKSVGLRASYRPKYFDRAEHNQTARGVLGFVVCRKLSFFGHIIRDGGCELYSKGRDTEGIALETTAWKT